MTSFHPIVLQKPPSPDQAPAVATIDCDVVLTAGAGAGKTRTLVARILHLLANGVPMRAIVAVTFTVKAAREMRNRLRQEITAYLVTAGVDATELARWSTIYADLDAARIGTIHSLCGEILRAHPAEAEVDPAFAVLEEAVSVQLRAEAIAESLGWATEDADAATLFAHFSADTLQAILAALLGDRLKAAPLLAASPWLQWNQLAIHTLSAALADADLSHAAGEILAWEQDGTLAAALAAGDTLAPALRDFSAAWRTLAASRVAGDLAAMLECLARLRVAVPGNKGKPANWGGADPKPVTRAFRTAFDEQIKPLIDGVDPGLDAALATLMPQIERLFAGTVARYDARKAERHALDFDDLEAQALALLTRDAEARQRWQTEVQALLVDEFQDTNGRQRDLVRLLNGGQGHLFIVGDAKQSIYRFRGADVEVFRQERTAVAHTGAVFAMNTSFRSHAALVGTLNALLARVMGTTPDDAEPWREPFSPLTAARAADALGLPAPYVEFHLAVGAKGDGSLTRAADGLVVRLRELITAADGRLGWGDIAILCRSARGFGAYEDAFERAAIPYETVAGRGFLDRPEVRDLLNALQALADPTDDLALYGLLRSPAIGLPDPALQRLRLGDGNLPRGLWDTLCTDGAASSRAAVVLLAPLHRLAGRVTVADLLKHFVDATGYRAILLAAGDARAARNVSKLLLDAQRSGIVSAGAFLEYVQGLRAAGSREGEARADSHGAVQIMSIHQAKGLEFPVVVIGDAGGGPRALGTTQSPLLDNELGVIPPLSTEESVALVWKLAQARAASKEQAESDRLLYVAATRACERLLFSGHVTLKKDGKLSATHWLAQLGAAIALEAPPAGFDPDGTTAASLVLSIDDPTAGQIPIGGVLYPGGFTVAPASAVEAGAAEGEKPAAPHLLAPVAVDDTDAGNETAPRVWRVVPRQAQRWAPSWVVGSIVHEAIAAWRFPDTSDFATWCMARARSYGLLDAARIENALRRTRRLLENLRRHPLYAEIEAADIRQHEITYATGAADSTTLPAFGQIDLLYQSNGQWTLVEFKTDHVHDVRARQTLLSEHDYVVQVEGYVAAAALFLGVRPRALLCLLDDGGACSVIPVGAAAVAPPVLEMVDSDAAWAQANEFAHPSCAPLLAACRAAGLPVPEVGWDIVDGRGRVMATAELAWGDLQLALFLPGQEIDLLVAGQVGWQTVLADDMAQCASSLIAAWNKEPR